jgi:hypothetical protein
MSPIIFPCLRLEIRATAQRPEQSSRYRSAAQPAHSESKKRSQTDLFSFPTTYLITRKHVRVVSFPALAGWARLWGPHNANTSSTTGGAQYASPLTGNRATLLPPWRSSPQAYPYPSRGWKIKHSDSPWREPITPLLETRDWVTTHVCASAHNSGTVHKQIACTNTNKRLCITNTK